MDTDKDLKRLLLDFEVYVHYCYHYLGLPKPTSTQRRIAQHLGTNPERFILNAFRGVGKTWLTAIFASWRLLRDVDEKILIVSASGPKAQEISQFTRKLFNIVPILKHLEPQGDTRDSVIAFDVEGCKPAVSPSVKALGITSQITGSRASLVILDDIEVPSNSMTELMREKLISRAQEVEALLIPDKPSSVIVLGTPQSMESIYNKLEYTRVVIPAEVPEDPNVYLGCLDDWVLTRGKVGSAVDERFSKEELTKRKSGYGIAGYKLQFMLDTTLSDEERYPLKLRDFITMHTNKVEAPMTITYAGSKDYVLTDLPNLGFTGDRYHKPFNVSERTKPYDLKLMSIDPSGTGTDETTYAILGVCNGLVYILDAGGTKLGFSDEALLMLATKAKEYEVNVIVPEKNYG